MGKRTMSMVALSVAMAFGALAVASAEKPVIVEAGNLKLTFNGGFTPKALPKKTFAPIVLDVSGKIQTKDGTQPPALREFVLELDRNIAVDVMGFPTCLPQRLAPIPKKECKEALVGKGNTVVQVDAELFPSPSHSESLLFNGGIAGGTTTLYIYNRLTQPITTTILTTVKITKIKNGRYGTKVVASVPVIAGTGASIIDFDLILNKGLKVNGKRFSVVGAKCPDGRLQAQGLANFDDGASIETEITRPCTGKG